MYPPKFLEGWRCQVDPRTLYKIVYLYYKMGEGPTAIAKRYGLQSGYVSEIVKGKTASAKRVLDAVQVDIEQNLDRRNCYPYMNSEQFDQALDQVEKEKNQMTKPTKPTKKQRDKKRRMTYEQAVSFFMAFFRGENADILVKKADVSDGYFYSVISELRKGVNTYATRAAVESFFRVGGDFRAARKPLTEEEVNTWQIMVGIKPEKVAKKPQPKTQKKPQKGKNPKVNRLPIRPVPSIRYFEKDGKIMVEETMVETRPATIEELTKLAIHSL